MRSSILLAVLAGIATNAHALCSDTLVLRSISVFRQSVKNSATLGDWNRSVLTGFDQEQLREAAPIALPPTEDDANPEAVATEALHFSKITSNCGFDSVSSVEYHAVTNPFLPGPGGVTVNSGSESMAVRRLTDSYFPVGSEVVNPKFHWTSDRFDIAQVQSPDSIGAWSTWYVGRVFRKPASSGAGPAVDHPVAGVWTYKIFHHQVDNSIASALAAFRKSVDSIGTGDIDSTRFDVVKFRYVYESSAYTGIVGKEGRSTFRATPAGDGWSISLPASLPLEVRAPDGRLVRRLQGGRELWWDGRDAAGHRVPPGVWVLRVQGIGAVPVPVR